MGITYTLSEIAHMTGSTLSQDTGNVVPVGISTDTRSLRPGDLFFALAGEKFDGDHFVDLAFAQGASAAVTHKPHDAGVCLVHPQPLQALQTLAAKHRQRCSAKIIAITGSCGKTTAKDMTAAVLGTKYTVTKTLGNFNNDIGCPLSLLGIGPETHYAIIEMGANHKGEIAQLCAMARPDESLVTMVGPAHLEGFGSIADVARAKAEIMEGLSPEGCFYVNADDPYCREMGMRFQGSKVYFGREGDVSLESLHFDESGEMVLQIRPVGRLRLPLAVRAHSSNVMIAVAVGLRHGIEHFEEPLRQACKSASRFKVVPVHTYTVLDDAYNANPASMKAALEALSDFPGNRKIAVLGDMFELGEEAVRLHAEVGAEAAEWGVDWLLCLGEHANAMAAAAKEAGLAEATVMESHEAAAETLLKGASSGDVILVKGSRGMKMERILHLLQNIPSTTH